MKEGLNFDKGFRVERDALGEVKIPAEAYYGIQTVRAYENFQISGIGIHREMNKAIVEIKMAGALVNMSLGVLDKKIGKSIVEACKEILSGKYDDQFILDVYQAGAGTPWHMNVNEVIANVALEKLGRKKGEYNLIDPHDHINKGQSTNDVIPTSIRMATNVYATDLIREVRLLEKSLERKAKEFKDVKKSGRTHLQDAVPITLGQEFDAWREAIKDRHDILVYALKVIRKLHIGGTAIGTGFNAHPKFGSEVVKNLRKITKVNYVPAANKIEKTQFMSDFLDLSSVLRSLAVDLGKIANDIRLLSSGPTTGLNEIKLPAVEPGSSIMPGKFNPSMAEMLNMVSYQVIGNDEVVKECASAGQLELNVMTPVLAHNLLNSLILLKNGIKEFRERCIDGIIPNKKRLDDYFEKSLGVGAALNLAIGYDKAAEVVKIATTEGKTIKDVLLERNIMNRKEIDRLFSKKNLRLG